MADDRITTGEARDEIDETLDDGREQADVEEASEQDFALRNVTMSNALGVSGAGTSAAAGAVIGSGGEMGMDPTTDEAEPEDTRAPVSEG